MWWLTAYGTSRHRDSESKRHRDRVAEYGNVAPVSGDEPPVLWRVRASRRSVATVPRVWMHGPAVLSSGSIRMWNRRKVCMLTK